MKINSAAVVVPFDSTVQVLVEDVKNLFSLVVGNVSLGCKRACCLLQEIRELDIVFLIQFPLLNPLDEPLNICYLL